ncbi:RNA-directed DNA polymerase, eukaryota, reverse transcriptase zinc-binding domain protein [Tanacetum coccineum]
MASKEASGLEEVPLGGSAYTWCHKSASKMSKLDRISLDHRPILLREASFDYGRGMIQMLCLTLLWKFEVPQGENPSLDNADYRHNSKGDIVNEVQSAFISERQILDGPFILNEIMQWCRRRKKQSLIFKVDFEKAYDSVRWDFLDDILVKFGFGIKWRGWIQNCLNSSKGSILVNGSPTEEFQFYKGLKQGTKVGENMSRVHAWKEVIVKIKSRLSNWKLKTLSIGGPIYFFLNQLGWFHYLQTNHKAVFERPSSICLWWSVGMFRKQDSFREGKPSQVWICQKSLENSQKRTREWMSDQEAKEIEAKAREIMPQPSTKSTAASTVWICQKSLENSQKRTREWMSDQEAKEIEAKAREIMPQPSTKSTAASTVWICQILQEISQKRTRERMSDQEAKEIKAEAREIMPQPSTVNCS